MSRIILSGCCVMVAGLAGAVTLGEPFSDGAILQRDRPVPVWGKSAPGEAVTVSFAGQTVEATAGTNGVWVALLAPMAASKEGRTLEVAGGVGRVMARDVLVGEVWLCAGQSNMEMAIGDDWVRYGDGTGRMIAQVTHRPFVRYMQKENGKRMWNPLTPTFLTMGRKSALAVYYGLELYAALDVPIGLVVAAAGGSNIDQWDPANGEKAELFRLHFNGFAPYAVRGALWYQGETNVREGDLYRKKLHSLYGQWTTALGCPDMSFYYVQIAPNDYGKGSEWFFPEFLEAQARYERENPKAAMTVLSDTGSVHDIHPNKKWIVAKRLALHAFKRDYGFPDVEDSSPILRSAMAVSNTVELVFDHAKRLYVYRDDSEGRRSLELPFEVAGTNGVWKPATVVNIFSGRDWSKYGNIYSNTVIIVAKDVDEPVCVRYAWTKPWHSWLYNQVDLPLGTFSAEVGR